jgi:hypothetical protein
MMTQATDTDQKPFEGDHYERLMKGAQLIANDENLANAPLPLNSEGLMAFAASIAEERLLDGLTDHDANTVIMLSCFDFIKGVRRMAWRITDWMSDTPSVDRDDEDPDAVVHALAGILTMTLQAFLRPAHYEIEGAK